MIENKQESRPKTDNLGKMRNRITVLCFRWLFLLFVGIFYFMSSDNFEVNAAFVETLAVALIYNTLVTLYTFRHKKDSTKASIIIIYFDILFISFFSYHSGGLSSDFYIFFYFLLGYCGLFNSASSTLKVGLFCAFVYSFSCIFAARMNMESVDFLNLLGRDILVILGAYGISRINCEVKKYNDLHKKEFKMARTDKLTGLANRHYFDQKLSEEVEYSNLTGCPLNILMFDLDNFKKFNDSYGHIWGDKLLTLFSDIIKQNIRKSDIPVRYGGEEFLIVIRDLDIYIAKSVGDRIRRQLEKQRIYIDNEADKKRVTVSCGVAQYPAHSQNIKEVIDFADKALYHAKETGKNAVVTYEEICKDKQ